MNTSSVLRLGAFALTAFSVATSIDAASTKDKVAGYEAVLTGSATYTAKGGGHSGAAADLAIDFTRAGGPLKVADAAWVNGAAGSDELTVAFWAKKYDTADNSAFWLNSTSASAGNRGFQAHVPWSNQHIYFDTAGCCAAEQRIEAGIDTFPGYSGDAAWWNDWHYYVFSKKADVKQIWIDGVLFLEGTGAAALTADFTSLVIGGDGAGNSGFHGVMDDFAILGTQMTEAQMKSIVGGALPSSLPAAAKLLAYWDFNDFPADGLTTLSPSDKSTTAAPDLVQVVHRDGKQVWTKDNVSLKLDGTKVAATIEKKDDVIKITYKPSPFLDGQSKHVAELTYPDTATGNPTTQTWKFSVAPYSKDTVKSIVGGFRGAASFSGTGKGKSGKAGDYAIDLGKAGGYAIIPDASYLNEYSAKDVLSVSFWQKLYQVGDFSSFWMNGPSQGRVFQAHVPWSNANIYFDTAGCCSPDQRISAGIDTFAGYTGDASWWQEWHHFTFVKNGATKQIYIDGQLFLEGPGAAVMASDIQAMSIGAITDGGARVKGMMDDFAVYSTGLTAAQAGQLASGKLPTDLGAGVGLVNYWNFNDLPAGGLFSGITPVEDAKTAGPNLVSIVHQDGAKAWSVDKVALLIDGAAATGASITKADDLVTIKYVPATLFAPQSTHTATVKYDGAVAYEWSFTVGSYTKDLVKSYVGVLNGPAVYTADKGGKSGAAGDYAIDLGKNNAGQAVQIVDASFMNEATKNDVLAVAGWQKLHQIADSAFFWATSPTTGGGNRAMGTHAPWSNNNLYFDTAGCCSGDQRISAAIDTLPTYTGDVSWWQDWHHFVFQKNGATKEIWIDGVLFLTGENTLPLPTDITTAYFGFDPPDNAGMRGLIDDMAIFGAALDEATVGKLVSGTKPNALPVAQKLLAYWDFNDAPAPVAANPVITGIKVGADGKVTITWTGGGQIEAAASVNGPWAPVTGASGGTFIWTPGANDKVIYARVRN